MFCKFEVSQVDRFGGVAHRGAAASHSVHVAVTAEMSPNTTKMVPAKREETRDGEIESKIIMSGVFKLGVRWLRLASHKPNAVSSAGLPPST